MILVLIIFIIMSTAQSIEAFTIGEKGKPWGRKEIDYWRSTRVKQRSYFDDVLPRFEKLKESFDVIQYGLLPKSNTDEEDFPVFALRTRNWSDKKKNILITGGVHGYETSGVFGAIQFVEIKAKEYLEDFNFLILPCISPWAYERVQRWNQNAVDPNRSFNPEGEIVEGRSFNPEAATEESSAVINFLIGEMMTISNNQWTCHIDLHETTDTDETEFRPAKAARNGLIHNPDGESIPDGFYLVQDETSPEPKWFEAMIESVSKVTHIAPADDQGLIIGEKVSQNGVIQIPCNKSLGLCAGLTSAKYRTTTEVYPDSPKATPAQCNDAQVACICGGLNYILQL